MKLTQIPRSFLFLQGVASPFFETFAKKIRSEGYQTYRINFCGGDLNFTQKTPFTNFQGKLKELPLFYQTIFKKHQITDIFLFGDQRAVHQPAILLAQQQNIQVHVFEEGYFRPFWITLEQGGVNANSALFKKIPLLIHQPPPLNPIQIKENHYSLKQRAYYDIKYRFFNLIFIGHFKYYQNHRPYNGFMEYFGWIQRFTLLPFYQKKAHQLLEKLITTKKSFFIMPLQLNSDAQIQIHSDFVDIKASIHNIIASFAQKADSQHCLIIKNHPLDTGIINYRRYSQKIARQYQIQDRFYFIEGGNLSCLIKAAQGMVVINSTSGLQALSLNCPVCVLGKAIYNIEGLTFQKGLDLFWQQNKPPEKTLFINFKQILIQETQINGNFFSQQGIDLIIKNMVNKLNAKFMDG